MLKRLIGSYAFPLSCNSQWQITFLLNQSELAGDSEPIKVKTKAKTIRMEEQVPVRQPTATELLQQSYNEMKRLRQQEKQEKINRFKSSMF